MKERFLGFKDLHKFDAASINLALLDLIKDTGLDLNRCVAQAYDGARLMSGDLNGLRKKIEEVVGGVCPYVHCYAHRLNLCLVDSCTGICEVRNLLGLLQAVYNFQSHSVKRSECFQDAQKESYHY